MGVGLSDGKLGYVKLNTVHDDAKLGKVKEGRKRRKRKERQPHESRHHQSDRSTRLNVSSV